MANIKIEKELFNKLIENINKPPPDPIVAPEQVAPIKPIDPSSVVVDAGNTIEQDYPVDDVNFRPLNNTQLVGSVSKLLTKVSSDKITETYVKVKKAIEEIMQGGSTLEMAANATDDHISTYKTGIEGASSSNKPSSSPGKTNTSMRGV